MPAQQLTQVQAQQLDQSVPAFGPTAFSSIINSLYQLGGVPVSYTTNATANTADTVAHTLGRVPYGFVVINNANGGVVYNGGASGAFSATATNITLKCTTTANAVTLFVF